MLGVLHSKQRSIPETPLDRVLRERLARAGLAGKHPRKLSGQRRRFLLVDYPGYGKNVGYAMIDSTRASADAAVRALEERLHMPEERLAVCTIGHSLGAAVALNFAARHQVERVVAIAPFTTLREEAARVVGWQLAQLLRENYDNRENLARIARHNPKARIGIFHGTADEDIPIEMGRELAREFPFVEFFAIDDANHVSVLDAGHDKIVDWMNR